MQRLEAANNYNGKEIISSICQSSLSAIIGILSKRDYFGPSLKCQVSAFEIALVTKTNTAYTGVLATIKRRLKCDLN